MGETITVYFADEYDPESPDDGSGIEVDTKLAEPDELDIELELAALAGQCESDWEYVLNDDSADFIVIRESGALERWSIRGEPSTTYTARRKDVEEPSA